MQNQAVLSDLQINLK